jgi:AraC family transcriptional regulator
LASDVGVHPVHLAATFRRSFGVTVGEYVRERRVERARRMLAEGKRSITEIAFDLGFANPSHFSRVFSAYTGATPLEYRKLHNGRHALKS